MIFSVAGHVEKVLSGEKTQTRRIRPFSHGLYCRYEVGKTYAVQPGRGKKSVGRILVTRVDCESRWGDGPISEADAKAEGGYTQQQYEDLWASMYPGWDQRWVIHFQPVREASA